MSQPTRRCCSVLVRVCCMAAIAVGVRAASAFAAADVAAVDPTAAAPRRALQVTPPEIRLVERTLGNGLRVLLYEDHSVPVATVEVWYHVGSKDERVGRSGFAHLFEHLLFQGSANVAPVEHKAYLASIGGRSNAATDFDRTEYYESFPSRYLEHVLWLEADRMRSLDISEASFVAERNVVKEERRQKVDNPPYGRLAEVVLDAAFTTHPYRRSPFGSMADLDAASLADVRAFHATYYVPNNATLVVAGDIDLAQTVAWVETHFGPISRGGPIPRDTPVEPVQTAERRLRGAYPNTPLPAVMLAYHVPAVGTPDLDALQVANQLLSSGTSSRLNRRLVYERQIATEAAGEILALEHPGLFFISAFAQEGHQPEEVEAELLAEVTRLADEPVTDDELVKAKNQLVARLVFERQTVKQRADAIAEAAVLLGEASLVNRQLAAYQKVTAADIQRAARTHLRPENRTVVTMLPESAPASAVKSEVRP